MAKPPNYTDGAAPMGPAEAQEWVMSVKKTQKKEILAAPLSLGRSQIFINLI